MSADLSEHDLRPYQAEMLEESMKGNIIVAMDTGSGKTLIAQLRIFEELKRCRPDQLCWLLAPSVALAEQQHRVLEAALSLYKHRLLSGNDDVDKWTTQGLWDAVLSGVRVVTSTPQVLLDALSHGFVNTSRIALLIFDEAHRCIGKTPMSRILTNFIHPLLADEDECNIPHILGLTASPVMRADVQALHVIEGVMCSEVKTPKLHRSTLREYVERPLVTSVIYDSSYVSHLPSPAFVWLQNTVMNYNLMGDPYVLELLEDSENMHSQAQFRKIFMSRKTYCLSELKSLFVRVEEVYRQVGAWAVNWYVGNCIKKAKNIDRRAAAFNMGWTDDEKQHLMTILSKLPVVEDDGLPPTDASDKFSELVKILLDESKTDRTFSAVIFARQRATVSALTEVLSRHKSTKDIFRVGGFVGNSTNSYRKTSICDLAEIKGQQQVLGEFRENKRNIIVSTSVLEEGIDIPSCHLVICWDPPENLVSFVQRRGRARQRDAKYVIFFPSHSPSIKMWEQLEDQMIKAYLEDREQMEFEIARESAAEAEDRKRHARSLRVDTTGALLTLENAPSHLYHLCQKFSSPGSDSRPEFRINTTEEPYVDTNNECQVRRKVTATVYLPLDIDEHLRRSDSLESWSSEQAAKRDAAFESYLALFKAGFINQNLLPDIADDGDVDLVDDQGLDHVSSIHTALQRLNPWQEVAEQWSSSPSIHSTILTINRPGLASISLILLLPCCPPDLGEALLHWNEQTQYTVTAKSLEAGKGGILDTIRLEAARKFTLLMFKSIFGGRMKSDDSDFPALFLPVGVPITSLDDWIQTATGTYDALGADPCDITAGLIHAQGGYGGNHFFKRITTAGESGILLSEPTGHKTIDPLEPYLEVTQVPKRRDFLHPLADRSHQDYTLTHTSVKAVPARICRVDRLPSQYALAALLLPCILHRYELQLVAASLRNTLLSAVALDTNPSQTLAAICKSSAREPYNYERLEFLGDCILKLYVSLDLMARHPGWPERKLTDAKSRMVSNQTLARASLAAGLDQFIVTTAFTGLRWRPPYVSELLAKGKKQHRELSMKTLADVVESLIGATFLDVEEVPTQLSPDIPHTSDLGLSRVVSILKLLFPQQDWQAPCTMHTALLASTAAFSPSTADLQQVEQLLTYTFNNPGLLLQALTHSALAHQVSVKTYQRIEFLGDAVLDYIVVSALYTHSPPLSHQQMHTARTALVNAHFLAFLCMELSLAVPHTDVRIAISDTTLAPQQPEAVTTTTQRYLWQYMRHTSPQVTQQQAAAVAAHALVRAPIADALAQGPRYPWALLARAHAPKFMSDVAESVLGAVYVDSGGDVDACRGVLRALGVLAYLARILAGEVPELLHPKEALGMLAGEKKVRYVVEVAAGQEHGEHEPVCVVYVGEVEVARVRGGVTHLEMETRAAELAVLNWPVSEAERCKRKFGDVGRGEKKEEEEGEEE